MFGRKVRRLALLVAAAAMCVIMLPCAVSASDSVTVRAYFTSGDTINTPVTQQTITVQKGLAAEYGYETATVDHNNVAITEPTMADALVAMNRMKFGSSFTPATAQNYLSMSSGYITSLFGMKASSVSYFVNGRMAADSNGKGYVVDSTQLRDGDSIVIWVYQDPYWADYCTSFDTNSKIVKAGENFDLTLKGHMAMGDPKAADTPLSNIGGKDPLEITTVDPSTGAMTAISGKTTDKNGKVTLSFDKEGIYYISAKGSTSDSSMGECKIVPPLCKVTVTAGGAGPGTGSGSQTGGTTTVEEPKTPDTPGSGTMLWGTKIGVSWNDGPTTPILANGKLYVAAKDKFIEMDKSTGKTSRTMTLDGTVGFASIQPTYNKSGNVVYVNLNNGRIEAVDLTSMKKIWTSDTGDGGQTLSEIAYDNSLGIVYYGTWDSGEGGHMYAVNATTGRTLWSQENEGGFYGDKAYVKNGVIYFASKADSSEKAYVYAKNASTGADISNPIAIKGDVCSEIVGYGNSIVFTAKNKHLYKFDINDDGVLTNMKTADISGVSTCSPAVLDGKAYLGTSAGKIDVVDLTTMKTTLSVTTPGYPQNTPTVSRSSSGRISILTTYNATPGGIYYIAIKDGKVADSGDLFVPGKGYDNYCMSKIISDESGVLYYKNDSGNIMAVKGVRTEQAKVDNGTTDKSSGSSAGSPAKKATAAAAGIFRSGSKRYGNPVVASSPKNQRIIKNAQADNDKGSSSDVTKSGAPKAQKSITKWFGDNLWTVLTVLAAVIAVWICAAIYKERKTA